MTDWQHAGDPGAPQYEGPPPGRFGGDPSPQDPQPQYPGSQYPGAQNPQYPGSQNPQYPGSQNPQYPGPPYPQYPAAQYPPPGAYPGAYGYPVPVAYPMPYQGVPSGPQRPGLVLATSVLAYINAGLLILAGALLLFGASIANDIEDTTNSGTDYGTELGFDGFFNFVAAGLLIAGAVMFAGRKGSGRLLLGVGNVIVIAEAIYWLVRFNDIRADGVVVYSIVFAALAVLPLAFMFTGDINRWLAPAQPQHG